LNEGAAIQVTVLNTVGHVSQFSVQHLGLVGLIWLQREAAAAEQGK